MLSKKVLFGLAFGAVCCGLVNEVMAQAPPVNASLVGTWNGYAGEYADVWGDGNYAYVGTFTQSDGLAARIFVLDVSTPATPLLVSTFFIPSPNNNASPQDLKVGNGLLFVALEAGGSDGVAIIDVRTPASPQLVATVRIAGFTNVHDVFYDNGFLYMVSGSPSIAVVDLTGFDPDNPPASPITTAKWIISGVGSVFVHDIVIKNGRLYATAWTSGLWIYDVSDVANTLPTLLGNVGGNSTHAAWPTDDGKFVVVGEERSGGGIKVYEITDNVGSVTLTLKDSLVLGAEAFSAHNIVMIGNRAYMSWYQAGLQVYDVNAATGALEFVASYDTSVFANNGTFAGNWGVYPLLGPDRVLLTDLDNGFFVVNVTGPLLNFEYPNGRPELSTPTSSSEIRVRVTDGAEIQDPATAQLFVQINGGPFTNSPMTVDVADYVGQLPTAPCGSIINYYVSISTTVGSVLTDPPNAPTETYQATSAFATIPIASYDFEMSANWTTSGAAADGQWNVGIPVGGGARGDPPTDFDGSGQCFLTDNVAGNSDVDGGSTILTSPMIDLSARNVPFVQYARWFSNSTGSSPLQDIFEVEVNNGGGWVNLETVGPAGPQVGGGWFEHSAKISDFIALNTNVQFRFIASDVDPGSVVEAGLDAFEVFDLQCIPGVAPLQPNIASAPNDLNKIKYLSIDATANGTTPLRLKVTSQSTGKVGWVSAPADAPSVLSRAILQSSPPTPRDWSSDLLVQITDCIVQPGEDYDVVFVDPVTFLESPALVMSTVSLWGDVNNDLDVGIADIVTGININTVGGSLPNTHGDLLPDQADGELGISDIVAIINQATTVVGTIPTGFTPIAMCP